MSKAIHEHETFKTEFEYFRDKGLAERITELKEETTLAVIKSVNKRNGGPITEGKVLAMIDEERQASIRKDIEALETKLRSFMDE